MQIAYIEEMEGLTNRLNKSEDCKSELIVFYDCVLSALLVFVLRVWIFAFCRKYIEKTKTTKPKTKDKTQHTKKTTIMDRQPCFSKRKAGIAW